MDNVWTQALRILPFVVFFLTVMMIKVVKVMTAHQQKMAEILNKSAGEQTEITALRQEIAELKSLVHTQVIQADDSRRLAATPPPAPTISDRLNVER